MNSNQAQKRLAKVRKGIDDILPPLYNLSMRIFMEVKKRFQEYKDKEKLGKEDVVPPEAADKLVQGLFREKMQEIEGTSMDIGRKVVRDFGLSIALESWIFSRRYILKNKGQLQGVPMIWRGVDDYFKRFMPPGRLEALAKMEEEEEKGGEAGPIVAPAPGGAIDSLRKSLKEMQEEGDGTPAVEGEGVAVEEGVDEPPPSAG